MMKLRHLQKKDATGMLEWMHDSETVRFLSAPFLEFTEKDVLSFIERAKEVTENRHYACVNDTDDYCGTISLKNIDAKARNAEYAICLGTAGRGSGVASFATKEILRIAFEELGLERVYLNVCADNLRAVRFYEKIGFIYEGTFAKHAWIDGALRDMRWYRMLREEYMGAHNKAASEC